MKTQNTEVSTKKKTPPPEMNSYTPPATVPTGSVGDFFDEQVVTDQKDIVIPRILLMHGTSQLVGQQKATQGDVIDSVSLEILANSKKAIEFLVIKQLDKVWSIEKWNGKKFEFERNDAWNPDLSDQLEFAENGEKKRRNARLSFYVLLARDAKSSRLPYMISFQRTSYRSGKNIASFIQECLFAFKEGDKSAIPMAQVFELGCHVESGDSGTYYVLDTKRTRIATDEEKDKAKYWFSQLKTKVYKVDEEKEAASEPASTVEREF